MHENEMIEENKKDKDNRKIQCKSECRGGGSIASE